MSEERDKYLTEVMGECWHEHEFGTYPSRCPKCGKTNRFIDIGEDFDDVLCQGNNFSTWEAFGKLWDWSQKQEWWKDAYPDGFIPEHFIHPDRFADAVYVYLKEAEK